MLTLDKALQSARLFSFQEQQVPNSYYCELKDIADALTNAGVEVAKREVHARNSAVRDNALSFIRLIRT